MKRLFSFLLILMLLLCGCGIGQEDSAAPGERVEADEKKTLTAADGTQKDITYVETDRSKENAEIDIYADEENNKYHYDESGKMVGYVAGLKDTSEGVADEVAEINKRAESATKANGNELKMAIAVDKEHLPLIKASWAHLCENHGDWVTGFALTEFKHTPELMTKYTVVFGKTYGKGGFIAGETATVTWEEAWNGTPELSTSHCTGWSMDGADLSILNDLTREDIMERIISRCEKKNLKIDSDTIEIKEVRTGIAADRVIRIQVSYAYYENYYDEDAKITKTIENIDGFTFDLN